MSVSYIFHLMSVGCSFTLTGLVVPEDWIHGSSIRLVDETWQPPENITAVNTEADEGWPFHSSDGQELWFTLNH